jgi:hypothetical protein
LVKVDLFFHGLHLCQQAFNHLLHSRSIRYDYPMQPSTRLVDQSNPTSDTSCHALGDDRQVLDW